MLKRILIKCLQRKGGNAQICPQARTVLIRPMSAALGDGVMTTAALKQLKDALPGIRIGIIVSERNRQLFAQCPLVDELVEDGWLSAWRQRGKWEVYIDYPRTFTTATILYAFVLHPIFSIAFDKENKQAYTAASVKVYDAYYPNIPQYHLNSYLKLTPFDFAVCKPISYVLSAPQHSNPYPASGKKNILICPWGSTRRLEARALAKAVADCAATDICFWILGKPEAENYIKAFKEFAPNAEVQIGNSMGLTDFLCYIYYADGLLAIDSAAVHIGCAYDKVQAALYNSHTEKLHFFAPLSTPNTKLILSGCETGDKDDYSTFSYPMLKEALSDVIGRIRDVYR